MEKDFDGWNEQKKETLARTEEIRFHEREVWWCKLGVNVGSEQDGVRTKFERPVLVVRNFNGRVLWIVPLTRTHKDDHRDYVLLEGTAAGNSVAIPSQLRLISSKRLLRKIDTLEEERFNVVVRTIKGLLPDT